MNMHLQRIRQTPSRKFLALALIGLAFSCAVAAAQDTNAVTQPTGSAVVFTGREVFYLMFAAVFGSLGTIGLLLGIDKILMIVLSKDANANHQRYSADSLVRILPVVIYGITIILVVLSVLLLGLLRIISAEGALGILASIVGYVLGKSSGSKQPPEKEIPDA
jgi:hypothetical protein